MNWTGCLGWISRKLEVGMEDVQVGRSGSHGLDECWFLLDLSPMVAAFFQPVANEQDVFKLIFIYPDAIPHRCIGTQAVQLSSARVL